MDTKILTESRKTAALEDQPDLNHVDQHTFDIEIQRMYLDKLKQQRTKIDTLTNQHRLLKQQLQKRQQLLIVQQRKLQIANQQASFKKKYQQVFRTLKQVQAECDKLQSQNQNLHDQLSLTVQQKNSLSKQMKLYLKDTDYKLNQQLCGLREVIEEKQKVIDTLRNKHAEEVKRLNEEAFRRELQAKNYREGTEEKVKNLVEEVGELNRRIAGKDEQIKVMEGEIDRWDKKCVDLEQEVVNKEAELEATKDQHQRLFLKMKFHIRSLKKQLLDRQDQVSHQKQNIFSLQDTLKRLQLTSTDLTQQLRLQKQSYQQILSRTDFQHSQDKKSFSDTAREFKQNIEDLIKAKNQLVYENDRLYVQLKQKESLEKVRSCLVGSQQAEINRVERIMRRI